MLTKEGEQLELIRTEWLPPTPTPGREGGETAEVEKGMGQTTEYSLFL